MAIAVASTAASAGESQGISFEITPSETGSYNMSVAGTTAETLEVSEETQHETLEVDIVAAVSMLLAVIVGRRLSPS